jgi:NTP pyrophosphatase (non-canonical NTP hydrolase)
MTNPTPLTIAAVAAEAHEISAKHGWWRNADGTAHGIDKIPEKLALVHSEISEALEEYRSGIDVRRIYYTHRWDAGSDRPVYADDTDPKIKPDGFGVELADAIIRIADLATYYGIDLERAIRLKLAHNRTRPMRHGGKVC